MVGLAGTCLNGSYHRSDMEKAKLFWTGRSQAVRLPKEFRFEGDEVRIWRRGAAVILEPIPAGWTRLDELGGLVDADDWLILASRQSCPMSFISAHSRARNGSAILRPWTDCGSRYLRSTMTMRGTQGKFVRCYPLSAHRSADTMF